MGTVDWTQFAPNAPAGGVDWGQHSGVAPIVRAPKVKAAPKKSSGGNWFSNTLGDIEDLATGVPNSLVQLGKATYGTARLGWDPNYRGLTLAGGLHSHGFLQDVVKGFASTESHLYSPLVHGDPGEFLKRWHEHPLGPVLDVATLLSLGGGGALRAARLGALGEDAATLARSSRVLRDRGLEATLPQARTLQGRIMQRTFDRWAMGEHAADLPVVGGRARLNRRLTTQAQRTRMARVQKAKTDFSKAIKDATPAERFAAPIVAEDVAVPDLLNMYRKLQADSPTRTRARYIKALEEPAVQQAIDQMRPQLVKLVNVAHHYESLSGKAAVESGIVDPAVREARAVLPQRLAAGARYEAERSVRVPGEDRFATDRAAMQHDLNTAERAYTDALKRVQSLTERVRAHTDRITYAGKSASPGHRANLTRARSELAKARATLEERRQARDFQREAMSNVPAAEGPRSATIEGGFNGPEASQFTGPRTNIHPGHPDLPPAFRFPHIGSHGAAGIFSVPLPKLTKVLAPGFTKRNEGIRFTTGRMIRSPDAWLEDFLTGDRFQYSLDWQHNVLDRVATLFDPEKTMGGLTRDESIYIPSHSSKATTKIPRALKEEEVAMSDLGIASHDVGKGRSTLNRLQRHSEGVVQDELPSELLKIAHETKGWEKLNEMGVRRIPKAYGNAYSREFKGTSYLARILLDRPTDVWRAFTLKFRPAWTVNNIVGQHVLFAMHHAGPAGAAAYLRALAGSPGGRVKLLKIAKLRIPLPVGWERTIGKVMDEIAPELHSTGFAHSQVRITHPGSHQPALSSTQAARAGRALKMAPKAPYIAVKSFGDANAWVNAHLADNLPRDAAFLANARPTIRAIQRQAKQLEGVNLKVEEALKRLDRPTVEGLVDQTLRQLGDFQNMSHIERTWIRRVVPFYSWFKVITTLTARYAKDYPARIKLVQAMNQVTKDKDAELPSWLEGAIPLGPAVHGVQPMLSTAGINPFQTIVQIGQAAGAAVHGKAQFGTANPGGLLNPFLQDIFGPGLYNRDPFTGGDYHGIGESHGALGRAGGAFFQGLPETRLYTTTAGTGYKSSLYENTPGDYLLNYFGWPIRKVRLQKAKALHEEGR